MAELLVKAVDATHSDPTKDAKGCYKRGDVVVIMPDGWQWGALELLPPAQGGKFVVVKLPGVDAERAQKYLASTTRRRRFWVRLDALPANVRATLRDTGTFTTTWTAVRGFLRDKDTGLDETNAPTP